MDGPLKLGMPCGKMPSKFPKQHKNSRASYCEQEKVSSQETFGLWEFQERCSGESRAGTLDAPELLSQSLSTVRFSGVKAAFLSRQEGGGKY